MSERTSRLCERLSGVEMDISALEMRVSALEMEVSALELRVSALEMEVSALEMRLSGMDGRFSRMEMEVSALEMRFSALEMRLSGMDGRLSRMEMEVSALEMSLSALEMEDIRTCSGPENRQPPRRHIDQRHGHNRKHMLHLPFSVFLRALRASVVNPFRLHCRLSARETGSRYALRNGQARRDHQPARLHSGHACARAEAG
jgi:hypothetical protein